MDVTIVRRRDAVYPPLLRQLHDPPARIHLRGEGDPDLLTRPCVAVVGARSCSRYGSEVARMLGRELAAAGVVVVSGLARGIDGEAHRGALAGGGATVAILGCGIDCDYPRSHAGLAQRVRQTGLIVSEYPPGVEPAPWRFPARKRRGPGAVQVRPNHAVRSGRRCCWMPSPCGPGVVSCFRRSLSSSPMRSTRKQHRPPTPPVVQR